MNAHQARAVSFNLSDLSGGCGSRNIDVGFDSGQRGISCNRRSGISGTILDDPADAPLLQLAEQDRAAAILVRAGGTEIIELQLDRPVSESRFDERREPFAHGDD